ncbi:MAG: hypothetical protein QXK66_02185 [Sulfolobales archaeon]
MPVPIGMGLRLVRMGQFIFTLSLIYLSSPEIVKDRKRWAERARVSLSKFVIERVLDCIRCEDGKEDHLSRADLIKRLGDSEEEVEQL